MFNFTGGNERKFRLLVGWLQDTGTSRVIWTWTTIPGSRGVRVLDHPCWLASLSWAANCACINEAGQDWFEYLRLNLGSRLGGRSWCWDGGVQKKSANAGSTDVPLSRNWASVRSGSRSFWPRLSLDVVKTTKHLCSRKHETMLDQCWAIIYDVGPTLNKHRIHAACLSGVVSTNFLLHFLSVDWQRTSQNN